MYILTYIPFFSGSLVLTPTSASIEIARRNEMAIRPNTSSPSLYSQYSNLTSTPINTTSDSSFKSPSHSNSVNTKSTKVGTATSNSPDEVSFLLQRPGKP